MAAPEPLFYHTAEENPNPLNDVLYREDLSLSAVVGAKLCNYVGRSIYIINRQNEDDVFLHFTPTYMAELISAARVKGYELPRFQEALLAHKRHYPSPLVAGLGVVAQYCMHIGTGLLGAYALATLAVTGVMRDKAEKIEATFAPDKMTTAASTPWAANVSEGVLIKGRLPKIGDPAVQVYARDTQELCELSQVTTSFYGITERAYQWRACQTFDITDKDSLTAFAPPVAAWHQLTGVPETDSSVLAKFEALSAQYTRLETQEKLLKKALGITKDARHQTYAAASILAGAKP